MIPNWTRNILKYQSGNKLTTEQTKMVDEGKTWLENWLNKRKALLEENAMFDPESSGKRGDELAKQQLNNLYQTNYENVPQLESEGLYTPRTDSNENTISIKLWDPDVIVHEQTHALQPNPQVAATRQLMENTDYMSPEVKEFWRLLEEEPEEIPEDIRSFYTKYGKEYQHDPNELLAKRNAVLKRYGKDPTYKYTQSDLENEEMTEALVDNDLDTFEDDFLLHFFNDVASNNKSKSMANVVKQGGKINRFKNILKRK